MDFHLKPGLKQGQRLLINLAMQQAFTVLKLPILELAAWVDEQIESNPLLEKTLPYYKEPINFDLIGRHPSLFEALMDQARISGFDQEELSLAESIIGNLDERGFLTLPLKQVAPKGKIQKLRHVLEKIQQFDPPGIAATSLQESLLIQLEAKGQQNSSTYARIREDFDNLKKEQLRGFNLSPASSFHQENLKPAIPDVIVESDAQRFQVHIVEDPVPEFQFSPHYHQYLENDEDSTYVRQHVAAGKWLLRILRKRKNILGSITRHLLRLDPSYFLGKHSNMPLITIKDMASALELSPSTITRAIFEKMLLCSHGLIPFKAFFRKKEHTPKEIIKKLIETEDKKSPLTDQQLAATLEKLGVPCARRTVTKQRQALRIPSARKRFNV